MNDSAFHVYAVMTMQNNEQYETFQFPCFCLRQELDADQQPYYKQLSPEEMACSMLCDDIPYELLATP